MRCASFAQDTPAEEKERKSDPGASTGVPDSIYGLDCRSIKNMETGHWIRGMREEESGPRATGIRDVKEPVISLPGHLLPLKRPPFCRTAMGQERRLKPSRIAFIRRYQQGKPPDVSDHNRPAGVDRGMGIEDFGLPQFSPDAHGADRG